MLVGGFCIMSSIVSTIFLVSSNTGGFHDILSKLMSPARLYIPIASSIESPTQTVVTYLVYDA